MAAVLSAVWILLPYIYISSLLSRLHLPVSLQTAVNSKPPRPQLKNLLFVFIFFPKVEVRMTFVPSLTLEGCFYTRALEVESLRSLKILSEGVRLRAGFTILQIVWTQRMLQSSSHSSSADACGRIWETKEQYQRQIVTDAPAVWDVIRKTWSLGEAVDDLVSSLTSSYILFVFVRESVNEQKTHRSTSNTSVGEDNTHSLQVSRQQSACVNNNSVLCLKSNSSVFRQVPKSLFQLIYPVRTHFHILAAWFLHNCFFLTEEEHLELEVSEIHQDNIWNNCPHKGWWMVAQQRWTGASTEDVTDSLCETGCIMSSETDVDKVMHSFSRVGWLTENQVCMRGGTSAKGWGSGRRAQGCDGPVPAFFLLNVRACFIIFTVHLLKWPETIHRLRPGEASLCVSEAPFLLKVWPQRSFCRWITGQSKCKGLWENKI